MAHRKYVNTEYLNILLMDSYNSFSKDKYDYISKFWNYDWKLPYSEYLTR